MAPKEISKIHANVCQVFANPFRIEIIEALTEKEHTTDGLAKLIGTTAANISQHIKMMRDRGVVVSERRGTRIFHRLSNDQFKDLFMMERNLLNVIVDKAAEVVRQAG
jgi:ArsR family transcriptional regulator